MDKMDITFYNRHNANFLWNMFDLHIVIMHNFIEQTISFTGIWAFVDGVGWRMLVLALKTTFKF